MPPSSMTCASTTFGIRRSPCGSRLGRRPRSARKAGHTSVKTVLDVYGHLYDEADVALRERLEAMFVPVVALPTDSWPRRAHGALRSAQPDRGNPA